MFERRACAESGRVGRRNVWLIAGTVVLLGLFLTGCFFRSETPTPPESVVPTSDRSDSPVSTPTATRAAQETATPTSPPAIEGPTLLRVAPSVVELEAGETRLVQVLLDNVENLHAVEFHISFEPGYVQIEDGDPDAPGIQIGAGMLPLPSQVMQNEADNQAGVIVYQVSQEEGAAPAAGSGMVASFTVRAMAEGGSPLRFNSVTLQGPDGEALEAPEQIDGLVIVGEGQPAEDTPTPASQATATPSSGTPAATPTPRPTLAPTPGGAEGTGYYHIVRSGENVFRLSLRYGTTMDAIVAANDLPSADTVEVGQVLLIPVPPPEGRIAYIVQPGDTLFSLAQAFGMDVDELASLNNLSSSSHIEAGQTLIVVP